ncbi:hypothetical protein [Deinococcus aluminii]|uniref:Uncharacterized protein n=1 Tax=Deinococcus aluminii TaxID=1656885 RepID=A0ABP9X9D8_9DEIO
MQHTLRFILVAALLGTLAAARPIDEPFQRTSPAARLSQQLATYRGSGLTLAQCNQRMRDMNTLLTGAGYRNQGSRLLQDGTHMSKWYHPDRDTTVMAFSGTNASGNAMQVGELAGHVRWNELIAMP